MLARTSLHTNTLHSNHGKERQKGRRRGTIRSPYQGDKETSESVHAIPWLSHCLRMPHKGFDGGIYFDTSDSTMDTAAKQVNLAHITKPWTRDAWERARPWVLEQRQKLESQGWSSVDGARVCVYPCKIGCSHVCLDRAVCSQEERPSWLLHGGRM